MSKYVVDVYFLACELSFKCMLDLDLSYLNTIGFTRQHSANPHYYLQLF